MPFDTAGFDAKALAILEVLVRARHRIRSPNLWCKDAIISGNRVCMIGALSRAEGISAQELRCGTYDVPERMMRIVGKYLPTIYDHEVDVFNDDPETCHADVMAVLDDAIADYRRRAGFILD